MLRKFAIARFLSQPFRLKSALMCAFVIVAASSMSIVNAQQKQAKDSPMKTSTGFAVLELFTSQGCSSCPSADENLAEITKQAALSTISYQRSENQGFTIPNERLSEKSNMAQTNNSWRFILTGVPIIGAAMTALFAAAQPQKQSDASSKPNTIAETKMTTERAILAGGCFWGMEDLFRKQPGIVSTRVGYSGGDVKNATYRNHGTHAEAIEVVYDPSRTNFRNLLEFFFQIHDPTTKDRQGNDRGSAYRSAIYYTSEDQKLVASDTIEDVDASGLWPGRVVTEVEPASDFWEAEAEHQDYLVRNPRGYTCHFPRKGWVLPNRVKVNE